MFSPVVVDELFDVVLLELLSPLLLKEYFCLIFIEKPVQFKSVE